MSQTLRKTIQRIVASGLSFFLVIGLLNTNQITAFAYTAQTGMIYSADKSMVESKVSASPDAEKANGLLYGKPVTVIDEVTGTDENIWYQITYGLKAGGSNTAYVPKENVLLDSAVTVFAKGTINASEVSLRDDAGTDRTNILAKLNNGHEVEMLDSTTSDGNLWYRVRAVVGEGTIIGWVYGSYVTVKDEDIETDEEYEEYLRGLGFPESYIHSLAVLHGLYPSWVFEPVFTELDWQEVIEAESYPGTSLIQTYEDDAKKSYDSRAYNWKTNKWVIYDSTTWVAAHPDFVAYCVDPRNFLNSTNIWMFQSLAYSSSHTADSVSAIIKGTFMESKDVLDYVQTFMDVAKESGVSAYHLAARVRQEQGTKGTSHMISGEYPGYEGYYNYFNVGTYGVGNDNLIKKGLSYAKKQGWDTRYKSILGGANFLGKNYIGVGQDTLYFQKFDVIKEGGLYQHQYMTNVQAAISESKSLSKSADYTLEHVFKIPVYTNMPEEKVTFTASGNRNNHLKDLSISGVSLTPTFSGDTTTYSVIVDNEVSSITVTAEAVVSASTVKGTGNYKLEVGSNTIKVSCKSASGDKKTYKINVIREGEKEPTYKLESEVYNIDKNITGVEIGTTTEAFLGNITCEGGTIKVLTASGEENTGNIATGNKVEVFDETGALVATKEVVIYGDVNGDGKINVLDAMLINKYTIGLHSLKGTFESAADVNSDKKKNVLDAIIINKYTIGLEDIKQK